MACPLCLVNDTLISSVGGPHYSRGAGLCPPLSRNSIQEEPPELETLVLCDTKSGTPPWNHWGQRPPSPGPHVTPAPRAAGEVGAGAPWLTDNPHK